MTYISPYQLLDDEREKNAKLTAERNQLLNAVDSLEKENIKLKAVTEGWLEFAADVQPNCMAGEEHLSHLRNCSEKLTKPINPS